MTEQAKRKPMQVGYARVSTTDQNLDLQRTALEAAGVDEVVTEYASGKDRNRPALEATLARLHEGDTLTVWKLDRLGRSVIDLANIVTDLGERGVNFRSLTEAFDTSTNGGKLVFHIFAAVAEYERGLIRERVREGKADAKRRGHKQGKPFELTGEDVDLALELYDNGASVPGLAKKWKVSRWTIYRALERARERRQEVNGGQR
jgi:DNA invertase Pin-like site-specific DNA recombinase